VLQVAAVGAGDVEAAGTLVVVVAVGISEAVVVAVGASAVGGVAVTEVAGEAVAGVCALIQAQAQARRRHLIKVRVSKTTRACFDLDWQP
jgi:hypothetical protein